MKHFIDIENIREESIDLGDGLVRESNTGCFVPGDFVQYTEKVDGSNASFQYIDGKLIAFSRKKELDFNNTLNGFWNFVQSLNPEDYKEESHLIFFGEWLIHNKINYDNENYKQFYMYDVFNTKTEQWQMQSYVKDLAKRHNLNYVHVLYEGPFISWEHARSFLNSSAYGSRQEGLVAKNQDKLHDVKNRLPAYLKIVNEDFKESMKIKERHVDLEKEANKVHAEELMNSIVTENRVSKELLKMRNEGAIPSELTPKDMGIIAKLLPKRIWEDCLKEENEVCMAAGEYAGKFCSSITMQHAKKIILGN